MDNIIFKEEIFNRELDRHFREMDQIETKEYIQRLRKENAKRFRSNYLRGLFEALYRGVSEKKVFFAECTANEMLAKLQYMTKNKILPPLSGFKAVQPLVKWLYDKVSLNTSLEAMSLGGVFIPNKDVLFVFINNSESNFWDDDKIFSILLHELCHLYAKENHEQFKQLFYDEYIFPFYLTFFESISNIFKIDITDEDIKKCVKIYCMYLLEYEKTSDTKNIFLALENIIKINKKLSQILTTLIESTFSKNEESVFDLLSNILLHCYHKNNIMIPSNIFKLYQEIIFVSEIVCISSFVHNKRPNFLRMLDTVFT